MLKPKAFIFDLDGVITDTAEFHFLAWKNLADNMGITIDRQFNETLKGVSRMDSLDRILVYGEKANIYTPEEKERFATEKNDAYKELVETMSPKDILPNILPLLVHLKNEKIKVGLASASKNAFRVIELLEVGAYFDYIADASKIANSKPAPDVFLDVMNYFGLEGKDCIGVEDAGAGIESIKAAKMLAVGIGHEKDLPGADLLFKSTSDIDFDAIIKVYTEKYEV